MGVFGLGNDSILKDHWFMPFRERVGLKISELPQAKQLWAPG